MKMVNKIKSVTNMVKSKGVINCLALLLVIGSVNSACTWIYHQPKVPDKANRFKRIDND